MVPRQALVDNIGVFTMLPALNTGVQTHIQRLVLYMYF